MGKLFSWDEQFGFQKIAQNVEKMLENRNNKKEAWPIAVFAILATLLNLGHFWGQNLQSKCQFLFLKILAAGSFKVPMSKAI